MIHPIAFVVFCACALTACVTAPTSVPAPGGSSSQPLLQGMLNIAAPQGYCVDKTASSQTGDSAIVMIGRCRAAAKVKPALVTVSVGEAGSANVMAAGNAELAAFFTSPAGRETLSRRGRSADLRVIEALSSGGAFLMRLQEPEAPSYWRAVLGLRGRLVSVSVQGDAAAALTAEESRQILDRTLAALRLAN